MHEIEFISPIENTPPRPPYTRARLVQATSAWSVRNDPPLSDVVGVHGYEHA